MLDTQTREPLKVRPVEPGGGLIRVAAEQAHDVVAALQARGIRCWVTGEFVSIDGRPARGFIALSANEKAERVQTVLDSIA